MALEAVVYQQDLFAHTSKELYNLLGAGTWSYDEVSLGKDDYDHKLCSFDNFLQNQAENFLHGDWKFSSSPPPPPSSMFPHFSEMLQANNPSPDAENANNGLTTVASATDHLLDHSSSSTVAAPRAKRRRSRSRKNKEEIENQRMTHIAVERNRRKQMNEYLSVLRSLMPDSYVQRVSLSFSLFHHRLQYCHFPSLSIDNS